MPADTMLLVGLGVAAIVVVWLVFSVLRKVSGVLLLIALAAGAYTLWSNPDLLRALLDNLGLR
ncbi:MAG: hypothetical protein ABS75_33415 [Pelagibacterium sp. SCN 63-23]|nr:MAG: hypothetical protein ABS75_33415 [Pelagibacterium sp. SCN 63-23]